MDDRDVLTPEERRALADWADDECSPARAFDGFADAVVEAWQREHAYVVEDGEERASGRRSLVVGIVAGLAAAAMVLVMIRTLPGEARSAPIEGGVAAHGCDHADGIASSARPIAPASASAEGSSALDRGALAVLTHHCMPCHDGDDSEAQAGALKVYDVRQPRWWRRERSG